MRSPFQLLKASWQLFLANYRTIFRYWLVSVGITLAWVLPMILIFVVLSIAKLYWAIAIMTLAALAMFIVLGSWLGAAGLEVFRSIVVKMPVDVKAALKRGWQTKGKYFSTSLWSGLAIMGGLLLLVIPGLIIGVFLAFTLSVFAFEGKSGTQAVSRSWELVKGRFWKTAGYLAFPVAIEIALNIIITVLGSVLRLPKGVDSSLAQGLQFILRFPFLFYGILLYQDLANPIKTQ